MTNSEHHKIFLLGDSSVGKSAIVTRYINNRFFEYNESTIGASFFTKRVSHKNRDIILDIWDTAGQERYNSLLPMYYRGAQAAIIVYDITSKESFNKCVYWYNQVTNLIPEIFITVVGNKFDLQKNRQVFTKDLQLIKTTKKTHFIDVSAKEDHNITTLFDIIIDSLPLLDKDNVQHMSYSNDIKLDTDSKNNNYHKCNCN